MNVGEPSNGISGPGLRIFISYRREDTADAAGRLYDSLEPRYEVFMDIDALEPGVDYTVAINEALGRCDVLLALIGQVWLSVADNQGRRRLDLPRDLVRLEIQAALDRGIRVIPVLLHGATVPSEEALPSQLAPLAARQAIEISLTRWRRDVGVLIEALERSKTGPTEPVSTPEVEQPPSREPTQSDGAPSSVVERGESARSRSPAPQVAQAKQEKERTWTKAGRSSEIKVKLKSSDSRLLGDRIEDLVFGADSEQIVVTSKSGLLYIVNSSSGRGALELLLDPGGSVSFSGDRRVMAVASAHAVSVWRIADGEELRSVPLDHPLGVALTRDGSLLAVAHDGAKVFDVRHGTTISHLSIEDVGGHLAFSANGRYLTVCRDTGWTTTEVTTGREVARLKLGYFKRRVSFQSSHEFSGDGRYVAEIPNRRGPITIYDTATLRQVSEIPGFQTDLGGRRPLVAFSPDERYIVGASGTVSIHETESGRQVVQLSSRSAAAVTTSLDGRLVAVADLTGVRLFDWSGRELAWFIAKRVNAIALSPDGDRLAMATSDGTVTLHEAR